MLLSNIPGRRPGGGQSSKYWYCQRKNRAWSFENNIEVCQTDFFPFITRGSMTQYPGHWFTWWSDCPSTAFNFTMRCKGSQMPSSASVTLCQICQILSWYWQKKLFQDYDKLFKSFKTALATEWQSWRFSMGCGCLATLPDAVPRGVIAPVLRNDVN